MVAADISASASISTAQSKSKLPVDRHWLKKLTESSANNDEPLFVLAPMVDQSDLPFRLLCQRYNTRLSFTPMIHARMFCESKQYRQKFMLKNVAQDRPLIAQVCGGSTEYVFQATKQLQQFCDGIDINCGCPQNIAKRGNYGAFLFEDTDALLDLVTTLTRELRIPVSVKVRLLPGATRTERLEKSLVLYEKLVDAGIHMLTVHGRTRHNKGPETGPSDWEAIAEVVRKFGHRIPIIANGSIASYQEAMECLRVTGCDGIMSSEAILEYPALFSLKQGPRTVGRVQLAREYVELCKLHAPEDMGQGSGSKCIRMHLHRILHADVQAHTSLRTLVCQADTMKDFEAVIRELERIHAATNHSIANETLSWYVRHRMLVRDENSGLTINMNRAEQNERESNVKFNEMMDDAADTFACMFVTDKDQGDY
jgi:tRNA-dihydrouridine synthase 1